MLRYKQSSDWFLRYGKSLFRYSNLPLGILSKAAVSLAMFGNFCGQTGPILSDTLTPSQGLGVRVGLNLLDRTGGVAYGTPRYTSIGFSER